MPLSMICGIGFSRICLLPLPVPLFFKQSWFLKLFHDTYRKNVIKYFGNDFMRCFLFTKNLDESRIFKYTSSNKLLLVCHKQCFVTNTPQFLYEYKRSAYDNKYYLRLRLWVEQLMSLNNKIRFRFNLLLMIITKRRKSKWETCLQQISLVIGLLSQIIWVLYIHACSISIVYQV